MLVAGVALACGCRDSGGSVQPDAAPPPDSPAAVSCDAESTIQEVQDVSMPAGTPVALCGVVVTAIDTFGDRTGSVYVMEPEGGPYSGVMIYPSDATASAGLQVGDLIDVTGGVKDEFALDSDGSGRTLTEIGAPESGQITLAKVGSEAVPEPVLLDPRELAASDDEAEKWEGVLVRFENVAVNRTPSRNDDTGTMAVTGPFEIGASLTLLDPATIQRDDCYASITGIGDYFFAYKILPRSADDLVAGGTGCPAPEEGEALCGDELDNDYDGFSDCVDFSCQETVATCTSDTTVAAIQEGIEDGSVTPNTQVNLTGVVVTAVGKTRKHLWVMDAGAAGPYNGIYVYRGSTAADLPVEIDVGAVVNIQGRITEYQTLTEIVVDPAASDVTFTGNVVVPEALTGVEPAILADDLSNEPYESVLVRLENVAVVDPNIDMFNSFTVGVSGMELRVGNYLHDYTQPAANDCFASLTGIMYRFSSGVSFSPRSAEDMVGGGTCN